MSMRRSSARWCASTLICQAGVVTAVLVAAALIGQPGVARQADVTWTIDNLTAIGGHAVTFVGAPAVVQTPLGPAVEFNGATDGLFVDVNPLQGLRQFTVEVVLSPAVDGPAEQRFFHAQDTAADHRALLELRMLPDAAWCLDTFLRFDPPGLTLIDRGRAHPAGSWHAVALVYDGRTMAHYVDGTRELEGPVAFGPMGAGQTSIGVRQNRVSWFKGRIRQVRITPAALPPGLLLAVGRKETSRQEAVGGRP